MDAGSGTVGGGFSRRAPAKAGAYGWFRSGIVLGSGSFGTVLMNAAMSASSLSEMDLLVYGGIGPRGFRTYLMRSSADRVLGVMAGPVPPSRPFEPWHDQQKYVTKSFFPFSAFPASEESGVCAIASELPATLRTSANSNNR